MINFDNTYARLPVDFYEEVAPSSAVRPALLAFNEGLADELGLDWRARDAEELVGVFSGMSLPAGARPIAMAYAGHQFGHFAPQLGDGRAILLGEVVSPGGDRFDIQLKGAGVTRFSRGGDGRSPIGPVIREYIVSEAMHALGVPTTRALAAVSSGAPVYREKALPGAVFARVASSHIRVGTFELFASRGQVENLRTLADYVIRRHYAELAGSDEPYLELLRAVGRRKMGLVARWMGVGFIHGVMNTDNTSVAGETIDYGPCAFMDVFRSHQVFSSIDHRGRYRYDNQGRVALWNLAVLANCLMPLVAADAAVAEERLEAELHELSAYCEQQWLEAMCAKLGLFESTTADRALVRDRLAHLQAAELDFTNSFRGLPGELEAESPWHERWRARLSAQPQSRAEAIERMNRTNPAYIPRNHQVERAIQGASQGDLSHFERLNRVLAEPFTERPADRAFTAPPEPDEVVCQTFCGT